MRYEVLLTMTITHSLAIEAATPGQAQVIALEQAGVRDPDKTETRIEVEVGNG